MKMQIYLYLTIIICQLFPPNSSFAEKSEWEIILDGLWINDIAHDGNYVWCATNNDGVLRYDKIDGSYIQYTTQNGLPENVVKNNMILSVIIDKKGIKWIGASLGIASFNDTTWSAYSSDDTGISYGPNNIAVDHNNVKWFTASNCIASYNDTLFNLYKEYQDESDLFIDQNNYKWFAGGERLRFDNKEWYTYPRDESFIFLTVAVDYNNRQFWGGVDNSEGLRIYDGENMTEITELFGESVEVLSLAVDSNNIKWIGTMTSLFCYDDIEFKQAISFKSLNYEYYWINDVEIDEDGSVWFVADGGLNEKGILAKYTPEDSTTSVDTHPHPEELPIVEIRPNPFNPSTTISYTLSEAANIRLDVYSISGQKIETLVDNITLAGNHTVVFDAAKHGSGIYIYRFQAGDYVKTGKMVMVK